MTFTAYDLPPQTPTQAFHCDACSALVLLPDLHAEVCPAQLAVEAPPALPSADPVAGA